MFIWTIDKQFDFCFGHRVWTQKLNSKFSLDNVCACKRPHGHQGKVKLHLGSNNLHLSMVTDFKHTNSYKQFLDDVLDHKFVWDFNDPVHPHELPELIKDNKLNPEFFEQQEYFYRTIKQSKIDEIKSNFKDPETQNAIQEKLEGFVFVDFVPTSENLCKWWCEIAEKMLEELDVNVVAVEYWETPKSHCKYLNPKYL